MEDGEVIGTPCSRGPRLPDGLQRHRGGEGAVTVVQGVPLLNGTDEPDVPGSDS